jgi:SulP family sulfate permease
MDIGAWRAFARGSRGELLVAIITVVGMLTIGLLGSLILEVLLSILDVVRRSAQPRDAVPGWSRKAGRFVDVERHHDAVVIPGLIIDRLDDRLFFANSRYFRGRVRDVIRGAPHPVSALIFDAESVTDLDTSGAQALADLIAELRCEGRPLRPRNGPAPRSRPSSAAPDPTTSSREDRYPTVRAAVAAVSGTHLAALESTP